MFCNSVLRVLLIRGLEIMDDGYDRLDGEGIFYVGGSMWVKMKKEWDNEKCIFC